MNHQIDYDKHLEAIMTRVAYLYFICKTTMLVLLVDFFVFKKPLVTLFLLLVGGCYYLNLKLFRWYIKQIKNTTLSQQRQTLAL